MDKLSSITTRVLSPTPVFFKKLRTIGLVSTAVSAGILGLNGLPEVVTQAATYLAVAGTMLSGVSQMTVDTATDPQP